MPAKVELKKNEVKKMLKAAPSIAQAAVDCGVSVRTLRREADRHSLMDLYGEVVERGRKMGNQASVLARTRKELNIPELYPEQTKKTKKLRSRKGPGQRVRRLEEESVEKGKYSIDLETRDVGGRSVKVPKDGTQPNLTVQRVGDEKSMIEQELENVQVEMVDDKFQELEEKWGQNGPAMGEPDEKVAPITQDEQAATESWGPVLEKEDHTVNTGSLSDREYGLLLDVAELLVAKMRGE